MHAWCDKYYKKVLLRQLSKQLVYQQEVGVLASTSFLDHFEDMPDPRMERQKLHSLESVLFIAVSAVICGAKVIDDSAWEKCKAGWDNDFLARIVAGF